MRTTIDIERSLLDETAAETGERSPSKAVTAALREFLRERRKARLIAALGTHDLDLDDWNEYRHQERS